MTVRHVHYDGGLSRTFSLLEIQGRWWARAAAALSVAICSILGLQSLISLNDNGGLGCGHSLRSTAITGSGSGSESGFQRGCGLGDGRGFVGLGLGGWSGFS